MSNLDFDARAVTAALLRLATTAPDVVGVALFEAADTYVMTPAKVIAPFDEGPLHDSGVVLPPVVRRGGWITVKMGFNKVYARRQHEELDWQHTAPGQAKYLETPTNAFRPLFVGVVGKMIARRLGL